MVSLKVKSVKEVLTGILGKGLSTGGPSLHLLRLSSRGGGKGGGSSSSVLCPSSAKLLFTSALQFYKLMISNYFQNLERKIEKRWNFVLRSVYKNFAISVRHTLKFQKYQV